VKVLAAEIVRLELDLVRPLGTSGGTHDRRPVVLVRLETDQGAGWGECAALVAPHYSCEYADGAEHVLREWLLPPLLRPDAVFGGTPDALVALGGVRGHPMAVAAVEMALLDAELSSAGRSLASLLGATRRSVRASAAIGVGGPDAVVAGVAVARSEGFNQVKCKVVPGRSLEAVRAARASFPDVALAVDANGAYRRSDPAAWRELRDLDDCGLVAIEQPFPADDLVGHAELQRQLVTPVLLDESITGLGTLDAAIALRACAGISLKAARVGGLLAARRLHDRCVESGLHVFAGGMLEAGLGRACSLAVAALPGVDLGGDLGPSSRYFDPDITAPHVLLGDQLAVPDGPGIGARPRAEALRAAIRTTSLRPG
jgi:O-succinylbenzoate synthase